MSTREASQRFDTRSLLITAAMAFAGIFAGLVISHISPLKIVVALCAVAMAFAAIAKIQWTLYAMIFLTYINFFGVMANHGAPPTQKPFIAFIFAAALFHMLYYRTRPVGWLRPFMLISTYGAICLLSLTYGKDLTRTENVLTDFIIAASIGGLIILLMQWGEVMRGVIWVLLIAGLCMGTLVSYQYLTHHFTETYWGFAQAQMRNIAGQSQGYRVTGPIGDANFFAQVIVVLIPLGIERFLRERKLSLRITAAATAGVCLLAIIFSFSRGGFLALMAIAGLIFIRMRPKLWQIALIGFLLLPLLFFIPDSYKERIDETLNAIPGMSTGAVHPDTAIKGRMSELTSAWYMFIDHPILGVGFGNFPVYYQQYSRDLGLDPRLMDRSAHSLYLQIAAETGLVGLGTFLFILFMLFRHLKQARKDFLAAGQPDFASIALTFSIAMAGYLTAAIFLHPAYPNYLWLLIGLGLGIPNVARNELENFRRLQLEAKEFELDKDAFYVK